MVDTLTAVTSVYCRRNQWKVEQPEPLFEECGLQGLLSCEPPGSQDPQARGHGGV